MFDVGLTLGKFMPFHKGHELLLDVALANCQELVILLGYTETDIIPVQTRANWIKTYCAIKNRDVSIIYDLDKWADSAIDKNGTRLSETFWEEWIRANIIALTEVDCVFTSDLYGAEIAKRIGISWIPVDPNRIIIPTSATHIRNEKSHWSFISDVAKSDLCLTIAVVGAESTGKTTLSKNLSYKFNAIYVPEYGRTLSEVRMNRMTVDDFTTIFNTQAAMIEKAKLMSNGLCITDTEAITTALFAPIYLTKDVPIAKTAIESQRIDLFLVLAPTVQLVQDGTRVLNLEQRQIFHNNLILKLDEVGANYEIIDDADYENRYNIASNIIYTYLNTNRKY